MKLIKNSQVTFRHHQKPTNSQSQDNLRIYQFDRGSLFRSRNIIMLRDIHVIAYHYDDATNKQAIAHDVDYGWIEPTINETERFDGFSIVQSSTGTEVSSGFINYKAFFNRFRGLTEPVELPEQFKVYAIIPRNGVSATGTINWVYLFNFIYGEYENV